MNGKEEIKKQSACAQIRFRNVCVANIQNTRRQSVPRQADSTVSKSTFTAENKFLTAEADLLGGFSVASWFHCRNRRVVNIGNTETKIVHRKADSIVSELTTMFLRVNLEGRGRTRVRECFCPNRS